VLVYVNLGQTPLPAPPSPPNPYASALAAAGAPDPSAISASAVDVAGKAGADALLASIDKLKTTSAAAGQDLRTTLSLTNAITAQKQANLTALKRQAAALSQQLAPGTQPTGLAGLGRVRRRPSRFGLADLASGSSDFLGGQIQKIDLAVKSGRWTDLLFNLAVLTPGAAGKTPHDLLTDPLLSQLKQVVRDNYNPTDRPRLKDVALAALDGMARYPNYWQTPSIPAPPQMTDDDSLMASAKEAVYDPDAWGAVSGQFSSYIAAHRPQGGGVVKSVTKAIGQVNNLVYQVPGVGTVAKTLDKYVPGWQVALNFVIPGGGLIGAVGAAAQATQFAPILGPALQTALAVAQPVTGIAPTGSFVSYGSGAVAQAATQVSAGFGPAVNLKWALTETPLQVANRFPFSVAKVTGIYLSTHGDVLEKLEAASTEAIAQVALVIELGAVAISAGGAAGVIGPLDAAIASAISSSTNAIKSTVAAAEMKPPSPVAWAQAGIAIAAAAVSVAAAASDAVAAADKAFSEMQRAQQAADAAKAAGAPNAPVLAAVADKAKQAYQVASANMATVNAVNTITSTIKTAGQAGLSVAQAEMVAAQVKNAADAAKKKAYAQVAQIDADTALVKQQIDQLKQQVAAVQRQRALVQQQAAATAARARTAAASRTALAPVADALGVSDQTVMILGAVGAIALIGSVIVATSGDEGEF
jgi:hypothetical protein